MRDLGAVLTAAALHGVYPPVDGRWERVAPWRDGVHGVLAFTGHAYVCAPEHVSDADIAALGVDGYGGVHHPRVVTALAGDATIHTLDAVLGRRATGGVHGLTERPDLLEHPRAVLARSIRDGVRAWGRWAGEDVLTAGRGLGGLLEIGIETSEPASAAVLIEHGLALGEASEAVLACCAPGNARAVRRFLRAGFRPLASVQLWHTPD